MPCALRLTHIARFGFWATCTSLKDCSEADPPLVGAARATLNGTARMTVSFLPVAASRAPRLACQLFHKIYSMVDDDEENLFGLHTFVRVHSVGSGQHGPMDQNAQRGSEGAQERHRDGRDEDLYFGRGQTILADLRRL